MSKKFYLAHPILFRHEVLREERLFEEETGIALINPFYELNRKDVAKIDSGEDSEWNSDLNCKEIVERDLSAILVSDGVVAVFPFTPVIGTAMEVTFAKSFNKNVYSVVWHPPWINHPWIKYFSDVVVSSFDELAGVI